MTDFDPGPGWRLLANDEIVDEGSEVITYCVGATYRAWVAEAAVPPLPTEPYTVINADWQMGGSRRLILDHSGAWCYIREHGDSDDGDPELRQSEVDAITSFEVLSEPRQVTAKAVMQYAQATTNITAAALEQIAREFGVES